MRVAVLTRVCFPYHGFGGAERHIYQLLKYLKRRGVELSLYTTPPRPGWRESTFPLYREPDVKVRFVGARVLPLGRLPGTVILDRDINYPLFAARIGQMVARDVRCGRVDLVYAQGIAGLGYAFRKRLGRIRAPVAYNPQGMEEFKTQNRAKHLAYAPLRFYARRAARLSDCVIASDDCMRAEVASYLRPKRLEVLRNGVDVEECQRLTIPAEQEALVERFELHETECIGVTVSRLEENKAISVLLRALGGLRVPAEAHRWKWFIVGGGPLAARLHDEARALGLEGRVVFTGPVSETVLHNFYEIADVFCLPSLFEGSSIATLEAMVHRCAIIASSVGGLPDKVKDGDNGFLTEPGSHEDIARRLSILFADRDQRRRMGEESSRIARERFSWTTVAGEAIDLFQELIRSTPRPDRRS
ncbi:MAG: glycosyltransferase family 4 protein [Acidobacteria bacterium]|nr:glycosyltransferase family 4 protein [Acidobacteriota bacterium]